MDNEDAPSSINFIPCVKWVKKGVAKQIPEKVSRMDIESSINHIIIYVTYFSYPNYY
jgi:hypothetical protein